MSYQQDRIKGIPSPLPADYDRQANFTDYGGEPPRGPDLNAEFNAIEQALDETQARLRLIQRDDGAVANNSIGLDQLKEEALIGVNKVADWEEFTQYAVNDSVFSPEGAWYVSLGSHVSSDDFETDLARGRWRLLADPTQFVQEARHWANMPVDELVPEGNQNDEYSARHHRHYADLAQTAAEQAKSGAEVAAEGVILATRTYVDTQAGINDTVDGAYFSVVSESTQGHLDLYQNSGGVASFINTYPNVDYVTTAVEDSRENAERAEQEADRAEVAREAAFVNAEVYDDTSAGLAATSDGEQFQVVEGDEIVRYLNDDDAAVEVARYPSSSAVDAAIDAAVDAAVDTSLDLARAHGVTRDFRSVDDEREVEPLLVARDGGTLLGATPDGNLLIPYETDFYTTREPTAGAAVLSGDGVSIAAIDAQGSSIWHWVSDFYTLSGSQHEYSFVDADMVVFQAWNKEGRQVVGAAGPVGELGEFTVTPQQFGVEAGAGGNMSPGFQQALDYLDSIGGGTLYAPDGVYTFSGTVYVPADVEVVGQSKKGTILQANKDHSFDTLTLLDFDGTPDNQKVVAMFATRYAADDFTDRTTENNVFRTLTIDWNEAPAGGVSSMGPLVASRANGGMIDRCRFINTLDGSLDFPDGELRGGALIFAFAENWNIFKSDFGAGDYYTVRTNLLSKNLVFEDCVFDVDKPANRRHQRHIIEANRPTPMAGALRDRFGDDQTTGIYINRGKAYANRLNDYFSSHAGTGLHVSGVYMEQRPGGDSHHQMFLRAHGDARDVFFLSNEMNAKGATHSGAVIAAVQCSNTVDNLVFTGNKYTFDAESLTSTETRAILDFGEAHERTKNAVVTGNIIEIRNYPNIPFKVAYGEVENFVFAHNIISFVDPSEAIDGNGPIPISLESAGGTLIDSPNIVSGEHSGS